MVRTQTLEDFSGADTIDLRDVIARVEELRSSTEDAAVSDPDFDDERTELATLESFLEELKGYGGDEQWEGDWYPVSLIRDSYFERYAMQFADDVGAINSEASWPNNCIDWERAARELQTDYSSVEFDGVTYWYR